MPTQLRAVCYNGTVWEMTDAWNSDSQGWVPHHTWKDREIGENPYTPTRRKEMFEALQLLLKLSLFSVLSFSENQSHWNDLFSKDLYSKSTSKLLHNYHLEIYNLLNICLVYYLWSDSLLTKTARAVGSSGYVFRRKSLFLGMQWFCICIYESTVTSTRAARGISERWEVFSTLRAASKRWPPR